MINWLFFYLADVRKMEGVANDCRVGNEIRILRPEFSPAVAAATMKFNAALRVLSQIVWEYSMCRTSTLLEYDVQYDLYDVLMMYLESWSTPGVWHYCSMHALQQLTVDHTGPGTGYCTFRNHAEAPHRVRLGFTNLTSARTNQDALSMLLSYCSTVCQYVELEDISNQYCDVGADVKRVKPNWNRGWHFCHGKQSQSWSTTIAIHTIYL